MKLWKMRIGVNAQGRSRSALALLKFEPDKPLEELHLWDLGCLLRNAAWHCECPGDRADEIIGLILSELSRRDFEVWHRERLVKELEWRVKESAIARKYKFCDWDWLAKVEAEGEA